MEKEEKKENISFIKEKMYSAQDKALFYLKRMETHGLGWEDFEICFQQSEMLKVLLKDFEERQ